MSLRLALLLSSLIIIGIIGFICHLKYQRRQSAKNTKKKAGDYPSDAELEEQINAPFFTENIISDIPDEAASVFKSGPPDEAQNTASPVLSTSLKELMDNKKVAQELAQKMLPQYAEKDLILEYIAVLPNVASTVKQLNKVISHVSRDFTWPLDILVAQKDNNKFVTIDSLKDKHKVRHLKCSLQFMDNKSVIDKEVLEEFRQLVDKLVTQLGAERRFSLEIDQADVAVQTLQDVVKESEKIIILYILAQPDNAFQGESLKAAVDSAGLQHGEFGFFHLNSCAETNQGNRVYSLANMYKPGSFEIESIDTFSTTGLCAFMQPALLPDPVSGFREMCDSCKYIADQISGVLTTHQRELLDEANYIKICTEITAQVNSLNESGVKTGSELAKRLLHH